MTITEGSFATIRPDETDYFTFDFNKEIGIAASFVGSITGDVLTVTVSITGILQIGHRIIGTDVLPNTKIISSSISGSGQGGVGTYIVDTVQTVASANMTAVADITSAIWFCTLVQYSKVVDPTPEARLLSDPTISGNITSILVGTMIDGASYLLTANATLSDGRVLVAAADVQCVLTITPEDEVLTVAEFRTMFPAFANEQLYSDATIAFWIAQATTMPVIDADRWGQFYNLGICLWVAHILIIGNATRSNTGMGAGVPASKSVNGVSLSYDTTLGQEMNAGWYGLTPYGNAFLRYLRMAGAGPMQIGTGYYWNPPGTVLHVLPSGGIGPFITAIRPW